MLARALSIARGFDVRGRPAACEGGPGGEGDDAGGDHQLRRFETLLPEQINDFIYPPPPGGAAPEASAEGGPSVDEATATLQRQVDHLKRLLDERNSIDREARDAVSPPHQFYRSPGPPSRFLRAKRRRCACSARCRNKKKRTR